MNRRFVALIVSAGLLFSAAPLVGQADDHVSPTPGVTQPAQKAAGTLKVSSSGGFAVGDTYIFEGTAAPGETVRVWWDTVPAKSWRLFGATTADANGSYRLEVPIGSAAHFSFIATNGFAPGTASDEAWQSEATQVVVGASSSLGVASSTGAFKIGSQYIFTGRALPGAKVTIWWDATPSGGWRTFGSTVAGSDGSFRVLLPIGSASSFRFTATAGQAPGQGRGWETKAVAVKVGSTTSSGTLAVGSAPGGFLVGGSYVFSGRTAPGSKVTVWWDAQPWAGWRVFGRTTADSAGNYRLMLPNSSAANFRFAATSGERPDATSNGGWASAVVPVTSRVKAVAPVKPVPTMTLDPRCKTGRAICVSKRESTLAWVVNGKIQFTMDVRFGSSKLPTRNGAFKVTWKSRNHVSSIYHSAMPFSLFFDGGRAVHFSRSFMEFGYRGNSAGCVNTRDYEQSRILFDLARTGDKVIVF